MLGGRPSAPTGPVAQSVQQVRSANPANELGRAERVIDPPRRGPRERGGRASRRVRPARKKVGSSFWCFTVESIHNGVLYQYKDRPRRVTIAENWSTP